MKCTYCVTFEVETSLTKGGLESVLLNTGALVMNNKPADALYADKAKINNLVITEIKPIND